MSRVRRGRSYVAGLDLAREDASRRRGIGLRDEPSARHSVGADVPCDFQVRVHVQAAGQMAWRAGLVLQPRECSGAIQ